TAGTGETNNTASVTQTSTLALYPDLHVTNLHVAPATGAQSGTALTITWEDSNTGDGAVTTSFFDLETIHNDTLNQNLRIHATPYAAAATGAIPAGGSKARQYSFPLPDGDAGAGHISVTVKTDTSNNVVEYNTAGDAETNNTAAVAIDSTVAAYPDLQA